MIALDTDLFSDFLRGMGAVVARANAVPEGDRGLPVVVAAEILRGRLNIIRQAEAGRGRTTLDEAYRKFAVDLAAVGATNLLLYTAVADAKFREWRAAKVRVGTQDLRIAAIAFAHGATLATRNARDFAQVPGLPLEVWA
jgi:tRNA(fMet)-specific endonuclease VapC